jgi:RimJ/RimL family protein N-acetyltransferase
MKLETERLILRQWKSEDYQPYAELCSDSTVMKYFLSPLSRQESDEQATIIRDLISEQGWGYWAVELKSTNQFIGFVGLHNQSRDSGFPNAPFIEIGWRVITVNDMLHAVFKHPRITGCIGYNIVHKI